MNIPKIKSHTFYRKKFKIKFGSVTRGISKKDLDNLKVKNNLTEDDDILALTDSRNTENKTIIISDAIEDDKTLLRVLLDEGIHACDDRLDNDVVHEYATSLSNFLWRCGYRRMAKQDDGLST
jgi:hypothetical protein